MLCSWIHSSWVEWNSTRQSEICQKWEFYEIEQKVDLQIENNWQKKTQKIYREVLKSKGREGFCLSFPKYKIHFLAFFPN